MIDKVGIIGAGAMGIGIAQVAAMAGCDVVIFDLKAEALSQAIEQIALSTQKLADNQKISSAEAQAILGRIHSVPSLSGVANCQLIIEAIVENIDVKKSVFKDIEKNVSETCILASNTSSLSITAIAQACQLPERVIGIHFFNPATIMKLVEIIPAAQSDDAVIQRAMKTIEQWGKIAVIAKDSPGFIVNKIARPFYSEAMRLLEEGIGTCAEIDHAMTTIGAFKMGPFTLMDFIGHDVNYVVTESVWKGFYYDGRYTPSSTQKRLVDAGFYGKKSGKGFYTYTNATEIATTIQLDEAQAEYIYKRILYMLINEAADTVFKNICSEQDVEMAAQFGVNYPKGLLAWAEEITHSEVVRFLDSLYDRYHEERYRVSPYLRDRISIFES